jgi:hypothetical protein
MSFRMHPEPVIPSLHTLIKAQPIKQISKELEQKIDTPSILEPEVKNESDSKDENGQQVFFPPGGDEVVVMKLKRKK